MQKLKAILFLALIGLSLSLGAKIDPSLSTRKAQATKVILREVKQQTNRPRVPSRQVIECAYDGEVLYFTFAYAEGECEATLTEYATGYERTYTFDSSECYTEITVGQLYESTLTLTTESGHTYTAELTSE